MSCTYPPIPSPRSPVVVRGAGSRELVLGGRRHRRPMVPFGEGVLWSDFLPSTISNHHVVFCLALSADSSTWGGRNFSPAQILTLKSAVRRGWVPLRLYSGYDLFHLDRVHLLCDYWGWIWRLRVRIARNFSRAWRTRGRSAEVHGEPLRRLTVGIDFPTGWWGM
jgi:hypothetical protein